MTGPQRKPPRGHLQRPRAAAAVPPAPGASSWPACAKAWNPPSACTRASASSAGAAGVRHGRHLDAAFGGAAAKPRGPPGGRALRQLPGQQPTKPKAAAWRASRHGPHPGVAEVPPPPSTCRQPRVPLHADLRKRRSGGGHHAIVAPTATWRPGVPMGQWRDVDKAQQPDATPTVRRRRTETSRRTGGGVRHAGRRGITTSCGGRASGIRTCGCWQIHSASALARPWGQFFQIAGRRGADLGRRTVNLERQIRDNGVTYNAYADAAAAAPLVAGPVPLILRPNGLAASRSACASGAPARPDHGRRVRPATCWPTGPAAPVRWCRPSRLPARHARRRPPVGGTHLHIAAFDMARGPGWQLVGGVAAHAGARQAWATCWKTGWHLAPCSPRGLPRCRCSAWAATVPCADGRPEAAWPGGARHR